MKKIKFFILFMFIPLFSEEEMVIPLQTENRLIPIVVFPIENKSDFSSDYLTKLEKVLRFDLEHNGRNILADDVNQIESFDVEDVNKWKERKLYYLVKSRVQGQHLQVKIVSILSESAKRIEDLKLSGNLQDDRRIMHLIADNIHKEIFDIIGIASTRFLYTVRMQDQFNKWVSEVWESDYDGQNARQLTYNHSYAVTPTYLPSDPGKKSRYYFYVDYITGEPKIYLADLDGRNNSRFSLLRGNQMMPAVSKQKDKLAFICDITGNPDLFLYDFDPMTGPIGKPQQIYGSSYASQGSPTFSPDGKQIAFVTNKDGAPRIYLMDIPKPGIKKKDIKLKLLTKFSKESTAPSWSPDGKKIAYCSKVNGTRQIFIYDIEKDEEIQLTAGSLNKENPTWASNSLHLIYNTTDSNKAELYLINLNQSKPYKISVNPGEKMFPFWAN